MKHTINVFVALFLMTIVGCADAPGSSDADPAVGPELGSVSRSDWEPAPAGCEGADLSMLELFQCEGEPGLGALVAGEGEVVCVDSLELLIDEVTAGIAASDPSPQPSYPDPSGTRDRTGIRVSVLGATGRYADPTPTPVVQPDTSPTLTQPSFGWLGRRIAERQGSEEQDPTPTPTTEE